MISTQDATKTADGNGCGEPPMQSTHNAQSPRMAYMPGIDGLRAIAVIAVLFYHAELPFMAGGYLGVEVFFVISGYLITSLLIREWQKNGFINLGRFWLRRARRLLPAVYLLILVVLAFAVFVIPQEVAALRWDALAAAVYANNWYQIFSHQSYFEAIGRPSLLRHLWSLAVEEQFYLIWPVALALLLRWFTGKRIKLLTLICIVGAVASSWLMAALYVPDADPDPSRIYYGTDTRAAGFLIGAALAAWTIARQKKAENKRWRGVAADVLGAVSLIGLGGCFVILNEIHPYLYLGGFSLVGILSIGAIVAADHADARLVPALLRPRLLQWVGLRSYSIYLWHWPVFMLTRPGLDVPLDGIPLMVLRFAVTCVLAEMSYRFVERPIREGALGRLWNLLKTTKSDTLRARSTVIAVVATIAIFGLGASIIAARPPDIPAEYRDDIAAQDAQTLAPDQPIDAEATPTAIIQMPTVAVTTQPIVLAVSPAVTFTAVAIVAINVTPTVVVTAGTTTSVSKGDITGTLTMTRIQESKLTILGIGDSVMLGAKRELHDVLGNITVDAVVSRQATAAIGVLRNYQTAGRLGDVVIIHIGNNGFMTAKVFQEMLSVLADVPHVLVFTLHVPRRWEGPNNTVIREGVLTAPNARVIEWHDATASNPELFVSDGVHLQPAGRKLYLKLITEKLQELYMPVHEDLPAGAQ